MPKKSSHLPSRSTSIMFMLLNTVVWGAALPIVKPILSSITPYQFLFWRFVLAAIFSLPFLFYYLPKIKHKIKTILVIIALELIGTTLALALLYEGLARTSAIEASLIATTTPIFIIMGGILFLKEHQEKHEWLGLGLALFGTILITAQPFISGGMQLAGFSFVGNLLVFGQNMATAAYFLLAKKLYRGLPSLFITTISFYVGIVSFGLLILASNTSPDFTTVLTRHALSLHTTSSLLPILYMALIGSIVGLSAYIKGQEGLEASEASLFTYLQPLVFIPLAVFWLGESFTSITVLAMLLIGTGVFVAEYRVRRR